MFVLVADREPMMCSAYKRFLNAAGYRVDIATDAEMAARLAMVRSYDAVVADVQSGGVAIVKALREHQPWLAALLVKASARDDLQGLETTAHTTAIEKPFTSAELIDGLRSVLRASGRLRFQPGSL